MNNNNEDMSRASLVIENERLRKENTFLRVFAQRAGCIYNNLNESGSCKSGYPGCACMDDLMAFMDEANEITIDPVDYAESVQEVEAWFDEIDQTPTQECVDMAMEVYQQRVMNDTANYPWIIVPLLIVGFWFLVYCIGHMK